MMHVIPIIYGVSCGVLSAGLVIFGKLMTPGIPAFVKVFLRFLIGGTCLIPFLSYAEFKKITKKDLLFFGMMGLSFVVCFNYLFFTALNYIDSVTASLILSAQPLMTLIAASIFFYQVPSLRVIMSFLITLIGMALVITKGQMCWKSTSGGMGELLMFSAVCFQIFYTFALHHVSSRYSAECITFAVSFSGLIFLVPFIGTSENIEAVKAFSSYDWLCMGYIGVLGTTLGFLLFSLAIRYLGSALGSLIVFSTLPVTTMIYSHFFECPVSMIELLGSGCVIAGLILGLSDRKQDKKSIPVVAPD